MPAEQHREFLARVADARMQDPMTTLRALAEETGADLDDLVHHALVSWASAGSEALLALEPRVLRQLLDARRAEDWRTVAGLVDWLAAGAGLDG